MTNIVYSFKCVCGFPCARGVSADLGPLVVDLVYFLPLPFAFPGRIGNVRFWLFTTLSLHRGRLCIIPSVRWSRLRKSGFGECYAPVLGVCVGCRARNRGKAVSSMTMPLSTKDTGAVRGQRSPSSPCTHRICVNENTQYYMARTS